MAERGMSGAVARNAVARCLGAAAGANARDAVARCLSAGRRAASGREVPKGRRPRSDKNGFTLIELLVALAFFSLAALALLNLTGESARSAVRVETRTLGGVVAENLAVEAMITPRLAEGRTTGETALAGRPWRWTRTVTATDDPDLVRLHIQVRDTDGQAAERTLFRSRARE